MPKSLPVSNIIRHYSSPSHSPFSQYPLMRYLRYSSDPSHRLSLLSPSFWYIIIIITITIIIVIIIKVCCLLADPWAY